MHRWLNISKPNSSLPSSPQRKRPLPSESGESREGFESPSRKRARAGDDLDDSSTIRPEDSRSNIFVNELDTSSQQESSSRTLQHRSRAFGDQQESSTTRPENLGSNVVENDLDDSGQLESSSGTVLQQTVSIETKMSIARDILSKTFRYEDFKSEEQENVIRALLSGENSLAILPTNAGKSLCYQLPALCFERFDANPDGQHGITLVISPLISLMTDQVNGLQRRGIAADALNGSNSKRENDAIFTALSEGTLKLLFCCPEKLLNETFLRAITSVPGGIRLLAVDEAHCIDEVSNHV
jgi:hypothetical protein